MNPDAIILSADELAEVTGGTWSSTSDIPEFLRISLNYKDIQPGDLLITTNRDQWHTSQSFSENSRVLDKVVEVGMAAVVRKEFVYEGAGLLRVEDSYSAFKAIANAVRDRSTAKRILVTGTEGKTGFKILFAHLTSDQLSLNTKLDSKNMGIGIRLVLANTKLHHQISLIEVAVPLLKHGIKRSQIVKPHLCVITEIGYEHLATHGSVENLIAAKASVVKGLQYGGCCVVKSDSRYYQKLRAEILKYGDIPIFTFGDNADDYAQLLYADFDSELLGWRVNVRISTEQYHFFLPAIEEHAPLSTVGVLAAISLAGLDVSAALKRFESYQPFQTSGRLYELPLTGGTYTIYDQSFRSSVLGIVDFFKVAKRLKPRNGGHKILVLGPVYDENEYGSIIWELIPPSYLRDLIEQAKFDKIFTIGNAEDFKGCLQGLTSPHRHYLHPKEVVQPLTDILKANDLLMIKGDKIDEMTLVSKLLREQAESI